MSKKYNASIKINTSLKFTKAVNGCDIISAGFIIRAIQNSKFSDDLTPSEIIHSETQSNCTKYNFKFITK